jgi:hypothetical protein
MTIRIEDRRRRAREKLRALSFVPLLRGSLVEGRRKCGKSYCACANDPARRHPSTYVAVRLGGKVRNLYVRPEDKPGIERALAAYAELDAAVKELTAVEVAEMKRAVRERRRTKGGRA